MIVLKAVRQNCSALEYADQSLKQDREIVLEAVKQNGSALEYADQSLKQDREVVLRRSSRLARPSRTLTSLGSRTARLFSRRSRRIPLLLQKSLPRFAAQARP